MGSVTRFARSANSTKHCPITATRKRESGEEPLGAAPSIKERLKKLVVGQDEGLELLATLAEVYLANLHDPRRCAGAVLLLGPTGTGKTHTALALAEVIHRKRSALVRIDCAEFTQRHEVAKLIGAPPGYIGYQTTEPFLGPKALNAARSENCSLAIVLLDEIEKAHWQLHDLLLGVMDHGVLRMGDGSKTCFSSALIVMTSNVGSEQMDSVLNPAFGFVKTGRKDADFKRTVDLALRKHFRPEFLNRLDGFAVYKPLTEDQIMRIIRLELREAKIRATRAGVKLIIDKNVSRAIFREAYNPRYGAREVRRVIQRRILVPLARLVTSGRLGDAEARRKGPAVEVGVGPDLSLVPRQLAVAAS